MKRLARMLVLAGVVSALAPAAAAAIPWPEVESNLVRSDQDCTLRVNWLHIGCEPGGGGGGGGG